jgi:hypothetical protein
MLRSTQFQAEYIRDLGLGGAMFWALDLDDFAAMESEEPYPLANTVRAVLTEGQEFPEFAPPGGAQKVCEIKHSRILLIGHFAFTKFRRFKTHNYNCKNISSF